MNDVVARDHAPADWVACIVLTVAPKPYLERVATAVRQAENVILGDPVLVDMARVATTDASDPLGGDLTDVAHGLHRELLTWTLSSALHLAPRFTFCVLVVHPDVAEADRLVRNLAATDVLSELPIVFRIGQLDPTPREADPEPEMDEDADLTRMILDSVVATAQEVDKTPEFFLTADQLTTIPAGHPAPAAPTQPLAQQPRSLENASTPSRPTSIAEDQPGPPTTVIDGNDAQPGAGGEEEGQQKSTGDTTLGRLGHSLRQLVARRSSPASSIAVIKDLSERAERVSMLYLVLVSEPVRPSRRCRKLRSEFALTLTRTLMDCAEHGRELWYVRTFVAGRELRAGTPLPGQELLRHRDFSTRWGEHFDLYDRIGDITDSINRDTSSFMRRGLQPQRTVVVFLASPAPNVDADSMRRLADLCAVAETIWVSFIANAPVADKLASVGAHFLRYHDDLVDELLSLIAEGESHGATSPPSIDAPDRMSRSPEPDRRHC